MSSDHKQGIPNPVLPGRTEPFSSTTWENESSIQEEAEEDVHPDPKNSENSDSLRIRNNSNGISGNGSNGVSVNSRKGANSAVKSGEGGRNFAKDQSKTDSSGDAFSDETKDDTDTTKLEPSSPSPFHRFKLTIYQNDNQTKKRKKRGNNNFDIQHPQKEDNSDNSEDDNVGRLLKQALQAHSSNKRMHQKGGNLDHQTKKPKCTGNKDAEQPQKVELSQKPTKTRISFETGTDKLSGTLKDEEDEYSDSSEDDNVEGLLKQALLAHSSNKKMYQKGRNLNHQTQNPKSTSNKNAQQPQRVELSHKPDKTTSGKIRSFERGTDKLSGTLKDEEDEYSYSSEDDNFERLLKQALLVHSSNNLDHQTTIEEVEEGTIEPKRTLKDDEEGASRKNEKSRNESYKTPNEKQPGKFQKCRKICRIIIYVVLTLFAVFGFVGFIIALNQKSATYVAREHGAWSPWGVWTECSLTCGQGLQNRSRNCSQPEPSLGGRYCADLPVMYRLCVKKTCPATDGVWSQWGYWTECSVTCGTGIHHRSRNCSNPVPSQGGRYCAGPPLEYQMCPIQPCPVSLPAFTVFHPREIKFINLASWDVLFQSGSDFNASTGVFNCSVAGIYLFSVTLVKKHGPNTKAYCHIYKNDDHVNEDFMLNIRNSTDMDAISLTAVMRLKEGDRVYLGDCTDPGSTLEKWTTFTGLFQSKE